MVKSVFFGYPEEPRGEAEVMRTAATGLRSSASVETVTWEQLTVDGRVVIDQVLSTIDAASMAIFDVSSPNPNVLYEAGYAIARGKPIWLTLDGTSSTATSSWHALGIARDIGYTKYRNSSDLIRNFARTDPLNTLEPLYDSVIEASLPDREVARDGILYCTTFEPFEAANRLNLLVESRQRFGMRVAIADPSESSVLPLRWYVNEMARSAGVLIHFAGSHRNRAILHNNRHAFIAGVARGLEIPVLMLAETDYPAPFDYQSLIKTYETAEECTEEAREWLEHLSFENVLISSRAGARGGHLANLRFGEHVAENERIELSDYFVETAAYRDVIAARDSIFVGHRGTGKTANAMQAYSTLASNKTNLAVLIKPPGFEFPAMMAVVGRLPAYQHDYFFDALWRFLIQTEIASHIRRRLGERPLAAGYDADEQSFLDYVENAPFDLHADASVRLDQALGALNENLTAAASEDLSRNLINESFHSQALAVLRKQLGRVLKGKNRVAVFVDNLDKGWERGTDFRVMARFILGLLSARGQIVTDFQKQDYWRDSIKLTVAIFLRSDIYLYLRNEAREPDKLPLSTVSWKDWEALRSIIEERYMFSGVASDAETLWSEVFCREIEGEETQSFLSRVVLPRPRDMVFMCNAAVGRAIDRDHTTVEATDFLSARETYSQYAFEALLVENGVTIPELEKSLLAFIDADQVATWQERCAALVEAGVPTSDHERIIAKLVSMSFFGVEVKEGIFTYPEVGSESVAALTRASRLQPEPADRRLSVHPAFHAFLGIRPQD
jgi:hypothetical protein